MTKESTFQEGKTNGWKGNQQINMCGYQGLRKCQICIAIMNLFVYYGGVIAGMIILTTDSFIVASQLLAGFIVLPVLVLVSVSIGVAQGFCGSIKEDKYCMIVHLVATTCACFFLFILVITAGGLAGSIRDGLQDYCDNKSTSFSTRGFDYYDKAITALGENDIFCNSNSECECTLPSIGTVEHRYAAYNDFSTYQIHYVNSIADRYIRMQQCKQFFERMEYNDKGELVLVVDHVQYNAFYLLREMEEQHGCAGICYRSNIGVASDSSSQVFMTNFNNNGASCLEHVKDHAEGILTFGTIYFFFIFIYSVVTLIFTGCFTCHKEQKLSLVEINWEKRTQKMMQRMGMKPNH